MSLHLSLTCYNFMHFSLPSSVSFFLCVFSLPSSTLCDPPALSCPVMSYPILSCRVFSLFVYFFISLFLLHTVSAFSSLHHFYFSPYFSIFFPYDILFLIYYFLYLLTFSPNIHLPTFSRTLFPEPKNLIFLHLFILFFSIINLYSIVPLSFSLMSFSLSLLSTSLSIYLPT